MKIELCASGTSIQVLPEKKISVNFVKERNTIENLGTVIAITPYVVVLKVEGVEFSVYSSGKIFFRNFKDEKKVKEIAERVYKTLNSL